MITDKSRSTYRGPARADLIPYLDEGLIHAESVEFYYTKTGVNVIDWVRNGKAQADAKKLRLGVIYLAFLIGISLVAIPFGNINNIWAFALSYSIVSVVFAILVSHLQRPQRKVEEFCDIYNHDVAMIVNTQFDGFMPSWEKLREGAYEFTNLLDNGQTNPQEVADHMRNLSLVGILY